MNNRKLNITVLEARIVFDAALAAVIADVVSHPSASDALLINDVNAIPNLHVVYVKANAGGANNGTSPSSAYSSLQSALSDAAAWNTAHNGETKILVAGGSYSAGTTSGSTFNLPDGVAIFGGYNGGFSKLDPSKNVTYLTGVANTSVVTMNGTTDIIDGFSILGASSSKGAAIAEQSGNLLLYKMTFASDQASNTGGAINAENSSLAIFSSTFTNNSSVGSGGALFVFGFNKPLTIGFSTFSGNTMTGGGTGGGAIDAELGAVSIQNSTFSGSSAFFGGALRLLNNSSITLDQDSFSDNISTNGAGGAIMSFGANAVQITNSLFQNNQASGGGALYLMNKTSILISNNTFQNNSASFSGGAIFTSNNVGPVSIVDNIFAGNSALQKGGAIFDGTENTAPVALTISGNDFTSQGSNTASSGNAIYLDSTESSVNGDSNMANWPLLLTTQNNHLLESDIFIL